MGWLKNKWKQFQNWKEGIPILNNISWNPATTVKNFVDDIIENISGGNPTDKVIDTIQKEISGGSQSNQSTQTPTVPTVSSGNNTSQSSQGVNYNEQLASINNFLSQMIGTGSSAGGFLNDILGLTQTSAINNYYDLMKWQLENAYNTPAAQMQRYKDAGLNPNLMYGNGSSGNSQSSIGSNPIDPTAGISQSVQLLSGMSQVGKTMSEISNIETNTQKQKMESDVLVYTIQKERHSVIKIIEEYKKIREEINNIASDTRLKELEGIYKEYVNSNLDIDLMQRKYNLEQSELNLLKTRADIEQTEASTYGLNTRLNMDIWTFNHVDRLDANIKELEVQDKELETQLYQIYGQAHAATDGMSDMVGNVAKIMANTIAEIRYGVKQKKQNRKNKK